MDINPKDTSLKATLERYLDAFEAGEGHTGEGFDDSFWNLVAEAMKHEPELLSMIRERLTNVWLEMDDDGEDNYWAGPIDLLEAIDAQQNPSDPAPLREHFPYEYFLLNDLVERGDAGEDLEGIAVSLNRKEAALQPSLEGMHAWGWVMYSQPHKYRITPDGVRRLAALQGNPDQPNEK